MHLIEHRAAAPASVVAAFRRELAAVDPASLSDAERVTLIEELERVKSGAAAAQARLTTAFAIAQGVPFAPDPIGPGANAGLRPVGSQVALARHEPPSQGDEHVRLALLLAGSLPRTMAALEQGLISEWTATLIGREAAALDPHQRHELDERLAPDLPRLSSRGARAAARRIVADIDAAAVRRRMDRARQGRRVSMRVVGDGMAYLSILAPLTEVAGAHASLKQHALSVVSGALAGGESTTGRDGRVRGVGAIMSDTALERLTGRSATEAQPVVVNIVMTDRSLLRWGEQSCSDEEPALIPGLGPVPAGFAREQLADPRVEAFYRRLFTSPDGRDLVAMDARARFFPKGLRLMIALRDQHCRTPFCDAPIAQTDHVLPHSAGGPTGYRNGMGLCQRCNLTKESPGYRATVRPGNNHRPGDNDRLGDTDRPADDDRPGCSGASATDRADAAVDRAGRHVVDIATPSGQRVTSLAPPLLGWGWRAPPDADQALLPHESVAERALRLVVAA